MENRETQQQTIDISNEFLTMSGDDFRKFLRSKRNEPSLSITINWIDIQAARRLKAFVEDSSVLEKQKRSASIKATKKQMQQEPNVFSSGVNWIEIK